MCLSAIALCPAHPRFAFVVAANRDEFHHRPAAPLGWWDDQPGILAGRDLQAGGSWLGLSRAGRFALLTNVRAPSAAAHNGAAPSRGTLVADWLRGDGDAQAFWADHARRGHSPYNLIAADFAQGSCWWMNPGLAAPQHMAVGLHGLSNAQLNTPWPKVQALKQRVADAMATCPDAVQLAQRLFDALADDAPSNDADLPHTGVALELERALSAAFIRAPQRGYGTRCSTVMISAGGVTQVWERSYTSDGTPAASRHELLAGWPPDQASVRAISTCAMPASSNGAPRSENPARL